MKSKLMFFIFLFISFDLVAYNKIYQKCLKTEMEFCEYSKLELPKKCYDFALEKCKDKKNKE